MTTCEECQVEVDYSLGQVWDSRIVYCPLHQAAPELLEALQLVYQDIDLQNVPGGSDQLNQLVCAALAKATEGG